MQHFLAAYVVSRYDAESVSSSPACFRCWRRFWGGQGGVLGCIGQLIGQSEWGIAARYGEPGHAGR